MLIHCPTCNMPYDCEPGKYECGCGTKFFVAADGSVSSGSSFSVMTSQSGQTVPSDIDRTIPPQCERQEVPPEADMTIPGKHDRKFDGYFEAGDLILGRYNVLSKLGQGGMGVVYKCFDETAGVVIALKALPPELSHNAIEMEDVKENFQLVHNLHHPNIASYNTLERDQENGNYYLVIECVEGEDLRRWIRRKRKENSLSLETVLPIIRQVATALDYAHEQKIIHRDIKPGNIMINAEGHVKVLDFGLAAQIHTSMTRVSMAYHGTSGTAPYMAPEQWRGKAQGAAADQYALAVMAYEMLAGHLPFESTDIEVLRSAVLNETPELIKGIPTYAQQALARGMSKESMKRFNNCSVFADALQGLNASCANGKFDRKVLIAISIFVLTAVIVTVCGTWLYTSTRTEPTVIAGQPSQENTTDESMMEPSVIVDKTVSSEVTTPVGNAPTGGFGGFGGFGGTPGFGSTSNTNTNTRGNTGGNTNSSDTRANTSGQTNSPTNDSATAKQIQIQSWDGTVSLPGGVNLEMAKVEAGTFMFMMRTNNGKNNEDDIPHQVTLTKDFFIGRTEVTQAQWKAVMGTNPSLPKGDDLPVGEVTWNDAMAFCEKLNSAGMAPSGWRFTLPTEAQWEYAARGGNKSKGYKYSGSDNFDEVAWYYVFSSSNNTHPVGQKRANELGLYDMSGNALEWCLNDNMCRGGSVAYKAENCLPTSRRYYHGRSKSIGFRLALVQTVKQTQPQSWSGTVSLPDGVNLEMVKVEAGSFIMSAKDGENSRSEVSHHATLTKDFYIGQTEVTQAQWGAMFWSNPSHFKGNDLPVEMVSWNDAMEFCEKLNKAGKAPSGWKFTLPTETQWEFAARGGNKSKGYKYSGSDTIDEVAWFEVNSGHKTHPVGQKKANELGLYDMSGNVSEWCLDDYYDNSDSSEQSSEFTRGNDHGGTVWRVIRSGDCQDKASYCRSAARSLSNPTFRIQTNGFRLALVQIQPVLE